MAQKYVHSFRSAHTVIAHVALLACCVFDSAPGELVGAEVLDKLLWKWQTISSPPHFTVSWHLPRGTIRHLIAIPLTKRMQFELEDAKFALARRHGHQTA